VLWLRKLHLPTYYPRSACQQHFVPFHGLPSWDLDYLEIRRELQDELSTYRTSEPRVSEAARSLAEPEKSLWKEPPAEGSF
jgi:hypothetical protein